MGYRILFILIGLLGIPVGGMLVVDNVIRFQINSVGERRISVRERGITGQWCSFARRDLEAVVVDRLHIVDSDVSGPLTFQRPEDVEVSDGGSSACLLATGSSAAATAFVSAIMGLRSTSDPVSMRGPFAWDMIFTGLMGVVVGLGSLFFSRHVQAFMRHPTKPGS